MINRANCNLKLSKLKLLTASAWRGSYLSHNSIFKEQQSVSTQNSYAQTSNFISHLGNKKPSADLLLLDSAAQIRVFGCADYLIRTDCQLRFRFQSSLALRRRTKNLSAVILTARLFWNFLSVFFAQRNQWIHHIGSNRCKNIYRLLIFLDAQNLAHTFFWPGMM